MSKFIKCINDDGQPRLQEGETYELAYDVQGAIDSRDGNSKSGYLVKELDENVLIPYVYDRSRFVPIGQYTVTESYGESAVEATDSDGNEVRVTFSGPNASAEAKAYAEFKNKA
jgi:hypothetical protein